MLDTDDEGRWAVVRNEEEQYSIWSAGSEPPAGWTLEGTTGSRQDCLRHIDEVWVDMRPRSLREEMERTD